MERLILLIGKYLTYIAKLSLFFGWNENTTGSSSGFPTLDDCASNCGAVFICNINGTNPTCQPVPAGTPGAVSLEICEQACRLHEKKTIDYYMRNK